MTAAASPARPNSEPDTFVVLICFFIKCLGIMRSIFRSWTCYTIEQGTSGCDFEGFQHHWWTPLNPWMRWLVIVENQTCCYRFTVLYQRKRIAFTVVNLTWAPPSPPNPTRFDYRYSKGKVSNLISRRIHRTNLNSGGVTMAGQEPSKRLYARVTQGGR